MMRHPPAVKKCRVCPSNPQAIRLSFARHHPPFPCCCWTRKDAGDPSTQRQLDERELCTRRLILTKLAARRPPDSDSKNPRPHEGRPFFVTPGQAPSTTPEGRAQTAPRRTPRQRAALQPRTRSVSCWRQSSECVQTASHGFLNAICGCISVIRAVRTSTRQRVS